MGRPRLPADELHGCGIRVRLTEEEKEKLDYLAKTYGSSKSYLIRVMINDVYKAVKALNESVKDISKEEKANEYE